jgi:hypothetical protein
LAELIVAIAIAVTTLVGATQLLYLAARQYRALDRHHLLTQEVANIMEDLMSRPWQSIASADAPTFELSDACRQAVPTAVVHVEIVPDVLGPASGLEEVRRITVEIDPTEQAPCTAKPVRLVAWRFRAMEETP